MTQKRPGAKTAGRKSAIEEEGLEVNELFLAELESRRARLRQLLRMVALEADRCERAQAKGPPRFCSPRTHSLPV